MSDVGLIPTDWEARFDPQRMLRERLQRAKDVLNNSDVDALFVFRTEDARYLMGYRHHLGPAFIVVDDPGTTDSIYATALVKAAEGKSPVPIKIDHRPEFSTWSTWEAQNWLITQGEAGNDGSQMIVFVAPGMLTDLVVNDMKTEAGVDLSDVNPVILTEQLPYFIHQRSDVPWGDTLDDLVKYAKANPGTVRYISGGPGAGQDAAMQWYMDKLGFTVKEIIGGNSGERALAVASGDGDVTVSPPDTILPHFEGGKLDVLMMSGSGKAPAPWEGVPDLARISASRTTPGARSAACRSPTACRRRIATGSRPSSWPPLPTRNSSPTAALSPASSSTPMTGAETKAYMEQALEEALAILKKQGVYWKDKQ